MSAPAAYADRIALERRGRLYVGLCPFHGEKTASFTVYPHDNHFHCFGCGAHGDAIGFIRRIEGVGFAEARERAGDASSRKDTSHQRTRGTAPYAARLIADSRPIAGTLAERYLREVRGLGDLPLPAELRFHPAVWSRDTNSTHPALIIPCCDCRGRTWIS